MDFLQERLDEGYNFIVVKRREPGMYLCTKDEEIIESGNIRDWDIFNFEDEFIWPFTFNVIYRIKDLIK